MNRVRLLAGVLAASGLAGCIMAAGMPVPLSFTRTTASPWSPCSRNTSTVPPSGVYLAALFSRLANTCVSRTLSPSTASEASGMFSAQPKAKARQPSCTVAPVRLSAKAKATG